MNPIQSRRPSTDSNNTSSNETLKRSIGMLDVRTEAESRTIHAYDSVLDLKRPSSAMAARNCQIPEFVFVQRRDCVKRCEERGGVRLPNEQWNNVNVVSTNHQMPRLFQDFLRS